MKYEGKKNKFLSPVQFLIPKLDHAPITSGVQNSELVQIKFGEIVP